MTPEYLEQLADLADPGELWRSTGLGRMELPEEKRRQLDAGVALRRYATHIRRLEELRKQGRSLLITPLSLSGVQLTDVDTPPKTRHYSGIGCDCHEPDDCTGVCADRYGDAEFRSWMDLLWKQRFQAWQRERPERKLRERNAGVKAAGDA